MPGTRSASADKSESTEVKAEGERGTIEYVDYDDYTLEIDRRGDADFVKRLPKLQRNVPVDADTVEQVEVQVEAAKAAAENEGKEPDPALEDTVPPEKAAKTPKERPSVTVTAKGEEKS